MSKCNRSTYRASNYQLQKPPAKPGHQRILRPHQQDGRDDQDCPEHVGEIGRALKHGHLGREQGFVTRRVSNVCLLCLRK